MSTVLGAAVKSMSPKLSRKKFRRDIQGLRMLAVVAVILDHLLGWPSGGFVGVDVFFVISGFLITGLLLREHDKTGHISFVNFYKRRVRRIIPASTVVLTLSVVAAFLTFNAGRAQQTLGDSIWSLFFAANWHFAFIGTDYFQEGGPISPLQHFWSLAVEEQFYLIWPWLMLAIFLVGGRRGLSAQANRGVITVVMSLIVVASFAWALLETRENPGMAYFSTFSRAWELGIGALVAVGARYFEAIPSRIRPSLAWLGLIGILISLFAVTSESAFPAPWAALPVLSTALVIVAGTGGDQAYLWPLTNRFSGYLGDISYSLYLWHFPAIIIGTTLFGDGPLNLTIIAAVFTLGSIYTFHLVEEPIRNSNWLTGERKRRPREGRGVSEAYKLTALSLLAVVTAGIVAAATLVGHNVPTAPALANSGPVPSKSAPASEHSETPELGKLQTQISAALQATEWPANVTPALETALTSPQTRADLMWCGTNPVDASRCTWGDPNATHTAVTLGNSISMTYVETIRSAIGQSAGWKVVSYGKFGCPFMDSANVIRDATEGCAQRLDEAVEAINALKPDVIFLSGIGPQEGVRSQLAKVKVPVKVVFLPGAPGDQDIHSCFTKLSTPTQCVSTVQSNWAAVERSLAAEMKATFVDTSQWFCFRGSCPAFVGKTVTKMDARHMTPEYAELIAPTVRESLRQQQIIPVP